MTDKARFINFFESDFGIFRCDPKPNYMKERRKYIEWRATIWEHIDVLKGEFMSKKKGKGIRHGSGQGNKTKGKNGKGSAKRKPS
jgi:hypothetical protein